MAKEIRFEDAMKRIGEILDILENGNSDLDQTLALYEEGMKLLGKCNYMLDKAEQKVDLLKSSFEQAPLTGPFLGENEDEDR